MRDDGRCNDGERPALEFSGIGEARRVMGKVTELEVCLRESSLSCRGWLAYRVGLFRQTGRAKYDLSACWSECRAAKVLANATPNI